MSTLVELSLSLTLSFHGKINDANLLLSSIMPTMEKNTSFAQSMEKCLIINGKRISCMIQHSQSEVANYPSQTI